MRKFNTKFRQSTVLHPNFQRMVSGRVQVPTLNDYITVNTINTHGEWRLRDMVPDSTMADMAKLYSALNKGRRR